MSIVSLQFVGFVLIALLVYYRLSVRWQNLFLLACSYAFYALVCWWFPAVLLAVTLVTHLTARRIETAQAHARAFLVLGICLNLCALLSLKYADFMVARVQELLSSLGITWDTTTLHVLLPVGLSFYVLQAISYLVDASQGQRGYARDATGCALYLAYFPKLTSGPIEMPRRLIPQFSVVRHFDREMVARGAVLLVVGLFRKLVIADSLFALCPGDLFVEAKHFSAVGLVVYFGAIVIAVYNDFAGYTEIVRGVSCLFGVELSPNFSTPFFARSVSEMWLRWHISLSQWLRTYLFLPMARALLKRHPSPMHPATLIVPPLVTMLVSGLWHGVAANFVLWGALMGLLIVGERIGQRIVPSSIRTDPSLWWRALTMVATSGSVALVCTAFFMSPGELRLFWRQIFSGYFFMKLPVLQLVLLITPSFLLDIVQSARDSDTAVFELPLVLRVPALAAMIGMILLFSTAHLAEPFIYQGF
jgi:D-alanyl-lipoteichoic acid acyltransferase DltB (MBOAT superfamily)